MRTNKSTNSKFSITQRFFLMTTLCGSLGIMVGAMRSQLAIDQCVTAKIPTQDCLISDFSTRRLENISAGFIAGVGAAIGASWHVLKQSDSSD